MAKEKDVTTETEILNAAKRVFQQKGMDGARMQEIADEAGINKALLHYYFRSKQLLFEAVFKSLFFVLAPEINKILNDDSSIFDKIKNFTNNYISFVIKHPFLPNFIIQELNRNPEFITKLITNQYFPNIENFKNTVKKEINEGIIKPIKPEQLFINVLALNIFPFVSKPILKEFLKLNDKQYHQLLEDRKTEVADFIINSIKI
ncbi:TetR/AcrR family transcriptional regulator [Lutibacter sp. B1]|uniref:TetR/AcrR family transcriptional regulator n=1 Tax=Lutibacter sp. B1 TaxID=2725996 RepID=UPI00145737E2|nr:TetR/AcrR family transcriptional regulator [Lutibacter sp. B1]NLP57146.1 TetR/AcrR family transcriptional regulator [Lutibacter sp. B1]